MKKGSPQHGLSDLGYHFGLLLRRIYPATVSVAESIQIRKMFAAGRGIVPNTRIAEQDARLRELVRTSESDSGSFQPA